MTEPRPARFAPGSAFDPAHDPTGLIVNDMPVVTNRTLARTEAVIMDADRRYGPTTIIMHPLMAIELGSLDDPLAALDAAIDWIVEDGLRKWRHVAADLHVAGTQDRQIIADHDRAQRYAENARRMAAIVEKFPHAAAALEAAEKAVGDLRTAYGRPEDPR